jgi:hypothetical protein
MEGSLIREAQAIARVVALFAIALLSHSPDMPHHTRGGS